MANIRNLNDYSALFNRVSARLVVLHDVGISPADVRAASDLVDSDAWIDLLTLMPAAQGVQLQRLAQALFVTSTWLLTGNADDEMAVAVPHQQQVHEIYA